MKFKHYWVTNGPLDYDLVIRVGDFLFESGRSENKYRPVAVKYYGQVGKDVDEGRLKEVIYNSQGEPSYKEAANEV